MSWYNGGISGSGGSGSSVPIGSIQAYIGTVAPTDWLIIAKDKTVGNAASGADYASDDYEDLFNLLKTQDQNVGIEDWASNDTVLMPPINGRVIAALDNAGGTSANVITDINADTNGGIFGSESHTLTESEMPSHSHNPLFVGGATPNSGDDTNPDGRWPSSVVYNSVTDEWYDSKPDEENINNLQGESSSTGGGTSHNNVSPTIFMNYIIKAK